MKLKGELNFLLLQLFALWNFSQGYLRPCTNTSLGAHNGTTVYAEIGKPVSVLFCVESETTIHPNIQIKEPKRRAGWRPANNTKVGTVREGRVVTNITINNVQRRDLNVTFSVKICTDLHVTTGWTNDEKLFFTFILQKQASIRLCDNSNGCSPNGTNVNARIGESAHVVFCVTSDVPIDSHVFIIYPKSRSGWYPPKLSTKPPHEQNNNREVKFEKEEDRTKIIIKIQSVGDEDFKSDFSVKIMSQQHSSDSTNSEFIFLTFHLVQQEPIHSRSTSKSEDQNTMAASTSANIPGGLSVDTIASAVMTTAEVIVDTANGTSTQSKTSTMMATTQVTNATTIGTSTLLTTAAPQRAPQMCRGENKTKTVHAVVGQSLNVSVCIVSYYNLSWQNPRTYRQVQVSLTPRTPGSLYYTVTITISNIQEQDRGNETIRLYNSYGSMDYKINLQVGTTTSTTAISTLPRPSRATTTESPAENRIEGTQLTTNSESGINVLYIGLPFAAVIVIFILGVIIYRKKGGAWLRTRKARTDDTGSTNEGEYANLKELDSATSPVIEEQEPVTSLTRDGGQELASDFSDQDSGRFLSDQGLVYLSIAHVANSNKNKKKKQERKTADKSKNKGRKKDREEEPVEYTTIDFEKSGKQVISEEEEQKLQDEEKQQKEETEKSEEKHDENSS